MDLLFIKTPGTQWYECFLSVMVYIILHFLFVFTFSVLRIIQNFNSILITDLEHSFKQSLQSTVPLENDNSMFCLFIMTFIELMHSDVLVFSIIHYLGKIVHRVIHLFLKIIKLALMPTFLSKYFCRLNVSVIYSVENLVSNKKVIVKSSSSW